MAYVDGFVAAVPTASRDTYREYVERIWPVFEDLGAIGICECWGDDVPNGEVTSFPMAVAARADETVVLAWTVWPDKAARDAGWARMQSDPAIGEALGDMPFDGKRMIFGGFEPILQKGKTASASL